MFVFITLLTVFVPVFSLVLVGFLWKKQDHEYDIGFVTKIAVKLSLPCLMFVGLARADIDIATLSDVLLASVAAYAVVVVLVWLVIYAAGLTMRVYLPPIAFGNTGNLGLPLALFAFGDVGLSYAIVILAVMVVFSFTFGVWLLAGGGNPLYVLKEPMTIGTLLGIAFLVLDWHVPKVLFNSIDLIGQMAIPLMLMTLGVTIADLRLAHIREAVVLSVGKFVLCTLVGFIVGWSFALPPVALAVLVLQLATPVAVTSYLLAEHYKAAPDHVASWVVVSTLLSMAGLPLILWLTL